jgi:hypothetical protein
MTLCRNSPIPLWQYVSTAPCSPKDLVANTSHYHPHPTIPTLGRQDCPRLAWHGPGEDLGGALVRCRQEVGVDAERGATVAVTEAVGAVRRSTPRVSIWVAA